MNRKLIGAKEALGLLGWCMCRDTLYRVAKDGGIRVVRTPGGHRRFFRDEIETLRKQMGL